MAICGRRFPSYLSRAGLLKLDPEFFDELLLLAGAMLCCLQLELQLASGAIGQVFGFRQPAVGLLQVSQPFAQLLSHPVLFLFSLLSLLSPLFLSVKSR